MDRIIVETIINAAPEELWEYLTEKDHIVQWNNAGEDWQITCEDNDFKAGCKFNYRVASKDGSKGYNLAGVYDEMDTFKSYSYTLDDGRKADVELTNVDAKTQVVYTIDPEKDSPIDEQKASWQSMLDDYKKYVESKL